ncbi:fumarylacetoacetate hydrolase family protein [Amycolatopsis rubida]|uniref:2-keto-4-pentenoate hydratase/2-oxohepta-3-ene-1,7-dioic acid hydratase (Catechol pathway) n=1 Tax=Amycolatopsis rubida TaxID=112413 RepID=A0A1I5HZ95_9PSEU|nr:MULTISPECIES: fumarylacetoacetate hydrolase family protein [Amycolatopsis]MYW91003.1 fumarylacetoacetate hydrolase family protein [Amycolatopsis rubida]NEC55988.1 fumarylacetoacetate hydrolase family protein [Amycolatopsis rubida]OAP25923.1 Homoprotocatechuate catabolism bifunctional isomerase/decarboxylase [Amycolatopsis sp. M39]SFO53449.1 2-keto-4-pentenoate hydratase/2-oxohepta-3-ene-1,7-dioic acid hydratase (catechol pathway) [Amycolatopsis rubida]
MSPVSSTTPPERPGKVIALHLNYPSRAKQRGRTPAKPSYFVKPTTSISTSGTPVERPAGTELLAFEGEIALIIGKQARHVSPGEGWSCVESVTAANDFGVYDLRHADGGSNLRSKGGDGFTPLGPATIPAAEVDPRNLRVRTWVNGELVQDDTTEDLIFDFGTLVADLSQLSTLEPGDVILTGTPAGSSVVQPGDTVEVEVSHGDLTTGRLVTPVTEGTTPLPEFSAQPKIDDNQREQAYGDRESAGLPAEFVLTEELKTKLTSVGTATLSAQLRKNGYNHVSIDGLGSTRPDTKLIGRARTLRYVPFREDLFTSHGGGFNAQKRAIDSLNPGDVLVMEARGEKGTGTIGDILALRAQVRGAAGIVTDGGVRDLAAVAALDIPTYHSGPHPAVLGRRHVPWDVDITVACGGATVQPGDVIVGDSDGVLVIPPHLAEKIADAAIEQERQETFIAEQVANGESVDGLYPMNERWKARYAQWRP